MPKPDIEKMTDEAFHRLPLAAEWLDTCFCEASAIQDYVRNRPMTDGTRFVVNVHNRFRYSAFHLLRMIPGTRWSSPSECWDMAAIAVHGRTILEGSLVFNYLTEANISEDEFNARLISIEICELRSLKGLLTRDTAGSAAASAQIETLTDALKKTKTFQSMTPKAQKANLGDKEGAWGMLWSKEQAIDKYGFDPIVFRQRTAFWSKFCHMLPDNYQHIESRRSSDVETEFGNAAALSAGILMGANFTLANGCQVPQALLAGRNSVFLPWQPVSPGFEVP